jgi:hypothetical protein
MPEMLTLFHGSNLVFDRPDLGAARSHRDFGVGFYTTTLRSQAEDWARSVTERFGGEAHLYVFEFDAAPELAVKEFTGISLEWLDTVKANRMLGGVQHDFDVVIGPVANDNTVRTVSLYVAGVYDAEEAMRRLRYFKANNQVSIHSQRAMNLLALKDCEHV